MAMKRWPRFRAAREAVVRVHVPERPTIVVRRMSPHLNVAQLYSIEKDSHDFPWTPERWREIFADPTHGGTMAEIDANIVGYATYQIQGTDVHVSNIAVRQPSRRLGVGTSLINSLRSSAALSFDGSHLVSRSGRLVVYCHEEALGAQLFLRSCRFPVVDVRRGYYRTDGRDCYVFSSPRRAGTTDA